MRVHLAFDDFGPPDGPPLVLLHGFPLDGRMWHPVARAAADAGLRVLVPDLRGHGRTPPGLEPEGLGAMAQDVVAWLDRLQVAAAHVAGHSMGGYVALELGRIDAARWEGLALVHSRATADTPDARSARDAVLAELASTGSASLADHFVPKMLADPTAPWMKALRQRVLEMDSVGAAQALQAMRDRPDAQTTWAAFPGKRLVVAGLHDKIILLPEAEALAADAGQGAVVLDSSAHLGPLEEPRRMAEVLARWVLDPA